VNLASAHNQVLKTTHDGAEKESYRPPLPVCGRDCQAFSEPVRFTFILKHKRS
jgi:DNA-binding XRE family transcriptional regulator